MANDISSQIAAETRRLSKLRDEGKPVSAEKIHPLELDDLKESFSDVDAQFLSDELLEKKLQEYKQNLYLMKRIFPEGSHMQLAALPCDINGAVYTDEEMKNNFYFTLLFVDDATGLSTGYGALNPTTHAKLLPKEIQKDCSFTVHYESKGPQADEKDFETFSGQFRNAYQKLRELLKR